MLLINQNTKIALGLFLTCILGACEIPEPKTLSYFYEDSRYGTKRYFKIESKIDSDVNEIRFYQDHLDSNFVGNESPRKILFQENEAFLVYLSYQFPINIKKVDSCHIYEYNPYEQPPPFTCKLCLVRNVLDTIINNRPIQNASFYKLNYLYTMHSEDINVIFDWDKKVVVQEKSKSFDIKLIKIE